MQITDRDIELLRFINSHGVATVKHIMREYNITEKVAYRRLRKLNIDGFLIHQRLFYNEPGIYSVSPTGASMSGDTLPAPRKLIKNSLRHDLLVTTVSQHLRERYKGEFITERKLRQKLGRKAVGQRDHLCDGELHYDGKVIAIEVELTLKSQARRQSIMYQHLSNFDINEIWYFCEEGSVHKKIKEFEEHSNLVKVYKLKDFLIEDESHLDRYVA